MFDPKTSGAARKLRVATTVQHELAHQWFGNLVTMDFWDGKTFIIILTISLLIKHNRFMVKRRFCYMDGFVFV